MKIDLKRNFWLFAFWSSEARGGLKDIHSTYDTVEEAEAAYAGFLLKMDSEFPYMGQDVIQIFDVGQRIMLRHKCD